jgi:hypothetical protein
MELCEAEVSLYVTAEFHQGHDAEAEAIEVEAQNVTFHGFKSVFGSNDELEHYLTDANGSPELVTVTKDTKKKIMELAKHEFLKNWRNRYESDGWAVRSVRMNPFPQPKTDLITRGKVSASSSTRTKGSDHK